ncbi:F-box domain-containing protein [Fusarium acuminatum]|uniref:F-box domain-containing protein n=1 Tax=Fusarium acuminatum TaxID=5515 RepID=A0ABZ2WH28_9HYPO
MDQLSVPETAIPRLDSLLINLTLEDMLYLRNRIDSIIADRPRLENFPVEIIRNILSNLDYDAYICCTRTSKGWRDAWTQKDLWTDVLKYFFPGLQELYPNETSHGLYSMARQTHLKWRQPHYSYTWKPWSSITPEGLTRSVPYPFLYNKGKFVWQQGPFTFNVGNFGTDRWQQFVPPRAVIQGDKYQAAATSDQLLVLYRVDGQMGIVSIVHLETGTWKKLFLPAPLHHAYVDSKTVTFVVRTGKILQFTWGSYLVEVDLTGINHFLDESDAMFGGLPKILLHPTNDNVMFAVWAVSHKPQRGHSVRLRHRDLPRLILADERLCSFVLAKFEGGQSVWNTSKSISLPNPLQNPQSDCQDFTWTALSFTCRKSDNRGTFCLGLYRYQGAETCKLVLCSCCHPRERRGEWGAVTFNVLTESFDHHEYCSPWPDVLWDGGVYSQTQKRHETRLVDAHIWNNDLVLSMSHTGSGIRDQELDVLDVQAVHPTGSHQAPSPRFKTKTLSSFAQQFRTQVVQDDDYVIVPLVGGVALCRPSETPAGVMVDSTVPTDQDEHRPLSHCAWEMTEMIELMHDEVGSGLNNRLERRRQERRYA